MPKRTRDYRVGLLQELKDPEAASHYLNAALEDSEEMFLVALRDVAEAHQIALVAEGAGLSRESVYRMLSDKGNPRYSSLTNILRTLRLKLAIEMQLDDRREPSAVAEPEQAGRGGTAPRTVNIIIGPTALGIQSAPWPAICGTTSVYTIPGLWMNVVCNPEGAADRRRTGAEATPLPPAFPILNSGQRSGPVLLQ